MQSSQGSSGEVPRERLCPIPGPYLQTTNCGRRQLFCQGAHQNLITFRLGSKHSILCGFAGRRWGWSFFAFEDLQKSSGRGDTERRSTGQDQAGGNSIF